MIFDSISDIKKAICNEERILVCAFIRVSFFSSSILRVGVKQAKPRIVEQQCG